MSTKPRERVVVDTNALITRLLLPRSIPGQAVRKAAADGQLLASDATIMELADLLGRPKFDPYITIRERQEFLRPFDRIAERIPIIHIVPACRDRKDDKFLGLAVNGAALLIITGDADFFALHPFRRIEILTPASYLTRQPPVGPDAIIINDPIL